MRFETPDEFAMRIELETTRARNWGLTLTLENVRRELAEARRLSRRLFWILAGLLVYIVVTTIIRW